MILFRVDGGLTIGMGHIYSSISIASKLRNYGLNPIFLMRRGPKYKSGIEEVKKNGFKIKNIEKNNPKLENKEIINFIIKNNPKFIFIDSYPIKKSLLKSLGNIKGPKVIIISYFNNLLKNIKFDYLINWFVELKNSKRKRYYLGTDFFPIHEGFSKFHKKEKSFKKFKKNVLVTIGGGENKHNIIFKIAQELAKIQNIEKVKIILGHNFNTNEKKRIRALSKKFEIFNTIDNMPKLMYNADLAITAGGNTTYELACIGTPAIYIGIVPHQLKTINAWQKIGTGISLGYASKISKNMIRKGINKLLLNKKLLEKMSKKGKAKVDGKGLERIKEIILR